MNLFKNDNYSKVRGGYSRLIDVSCRKCGTYILTYQKDGPGNLRRMYLDRIVFPKKHQMFAEKKLDNIASLKCKECKELLAYPYIYKKENRISYKVFVDSLIKKIISQKDFKKRAKK